MKHSFAERLERILDRLTDLDVGEKSSYVEFIVKDTRDLNAHGEWGIALENLCDNLYEESVPLTRELCDDLTELAKDMGLKRNCFKLLDELVSS